MHCTHCGERLDSDARFCVQCGAPVSDATPTTVEMLVNAGMEVAPVDENSTCETCGKHAPTKYNAFYANIGMLVMRRQKHIKAKMCRACTDNYFWRFTATNLFLGWWGAISFFVTCFFMLNNVGRYIGTLGLKRSF